MKKTIEQLRLGLKDVATTLNSEMAANLGQVAMGLASGWFVGVAVNEGTGLESSMYIIATIPISTEWVYFLS